MGSVGFSRRCCGSGRSRRTAQNRGPEWTPWCTRSRSPCCRGVTLAALIWWPGSDGAWLVLTVLVVSQFGVATTVKRSLARIAGTIVGVAIAAIVASVSGSEAVVIGIAWSGP